MKLIPSGDLRTFVWALVAFVLVTAEDLESKFLRRKRLPDRAGRHFPHGAEEVSVLMGERMENLWHHASLAAQFEVHGKRVLGSSGDLSMSMSPGPAGPSGSPIRPSMPTSGPEARTSQPFDEPTIPPAPSPAHITPGPSTSCLLGRTRDEYFFDLLDPITSGRMLNDPLTPQGQAFDFLVNRDSYLGNPCDSRTIEQRYGLVTLYYAAGGQSWLNSTGWLGSQQECSWAGVTCPDQSLLAHKLKLCKFSKSFFDAAGNILFT